MQVLQQFCRVVGGIEVQNVRPSKRSGLLAGMGMGFKNTVAIRSIVKDTIINIIGILRKSVVAGDFW